MPYALHHCASPTPDTQMKQPAPPKDVSKCSKQTLRTEMIPNLEQFAWIGQITFSVAAAASASSSSSSYQSKKNRSLENKGRVCFLQWQELRVPQKVCKPMGTSPLARQPCPRPIWKQILGPASPGGFPRTGGSSFPWLQPKPVPTPSCREPPGTEPTPSRYAAAELKPSLACWRCRDVWGT